MRLINGDCLKEMDNLIMEGVKVDAIITSPPYNIGKMHSDNLQFGTYAGNDMEEKEYQSWQLEVLNRCYDILKEDGSLFYNHKVRIKHGIGIHPLEWIFKSKFVLKQEITWDMGKSANSDKIRFFPYSERIYWLAKTPKTKIFNEMSLSDVWRVVPTHKRKDTGHIAVMPQGIVGNILQSLPKNILVLDPFLGSGSTAVACKNLGLDFIGIELDTDYFNIAKERINSTEQSLFSQEH